MNFSNKTVLIAPHTPRTTMFKTQLKETFPSVKILGFIDKVKEGKDIYKLDDTPQLKFDYILILSQNHFDSIYKDYHIIINKRKLIKVDIKNEQYLFFNHWDIKKELIKKLPWKVKLTLFKQMVKYFDTQMRSQIVFLSKSFISANNKSLYVYCCEQGLDVVMITDNEEQLLELQRLNLPVEPLNSVLSLYHLSKASFVIQDQGNSNYLLPYLSDKQKTVQLWHGIPLKRMNLLVGHIYDYYVGTSTYVNNTSMSAVIQSKVYTDYGYPRNDLLLKEHTSLDLLFYDKRLYELAQKEKVIVYMPTHREASSGLENKSKQLVPIDFRVLNEKMKALNTYFIIKFHPFVMQFYEDIQNSNEYTHILFHSIQGDIYPLLKYTDILITDYSSIYFDFLMVDKPIIFFDYDYEEYSSNMNGFVYDYETCAPGRKAATQEELYEEIELLFNGCDNYKEQRKQVYDQFITYQDEKASKRVVNHIINRIDNE